MSFLLYHKVEHCVYLRMYVGTCLSMYLPIYVPTYLCTYPSMYLSFYVPTFVGFKFQRGNDIPSFFFTWAQFPETFFLQNFERKKKKIVENSLIDVSNTQQACQVENGVNIFDVEFLFSVFYVLKYWQKKKLILGVGCSESQSF